MGDDLELRSPNDLQQPPCLSREVKFRAVSPVSNAVDLLFVVDSADGADDEQTAIVESLPTLVDGLSGPVDRDDDGHSDQGVAHDVNLGVITMDAGTQGYAVATCRDSRDGDDGILIHESRAGGAGCQDDEYPAYAGTCSLPRPRSSDTRRREQGRRGLPPHAMSGSRSRHFEGPRWNAPRERTPVFSEQTRCSPSCS